MISERGIRIGLRVVLVGSLALNALAIGAGWRLWTFLSETGMANTWLSGPERRAVRRALIDEQASYADDMAALAEARVRMLDLAKASPLDAAALEAAQEDVIRLTVVVQRRLQDITIETVQQGSEP